MALNQKKAADSFFCVVDHFFDEEFCDKVYEYSVSRGRPWGEYHNRHKHSSLALHLIGSLGAYVTTSDAFDPTINLNDIWKEDIERAISLKVVR